MKTLFASNRFQTPFLFSTPPQQAFTPFLNLTPGECISKVRNWSIFLIQFRSHAVPTYSTSSTSYC